MGRPMLDITSDIQSLTTFRRRSGDFMKQLKKSKRPVVLTVKGKAAAIVQDAEAYQRLLDIAAQRRCGRRHPSGAGRRGARTNPPRAKEYSTKFAANMTYRVELAHRAFRDLEILYVEKNAAESQAAVKWYNGLEEAVYTLATLPHRCPVAPEAPEDEAEVMTPALWQEAPCLSSHL